MMFRALVLSSLVASAQATCASLFPNALPAEDFPAMPGANFIAASSVSDFPDAVPAETSPANCGTAGNPALIWGPITFSANTSNTISTGRFSDISGADVRLGLLTESVMAGATTEGMCDAVRCVDDCGSLDSCITEDMVAGANYWVMLTFLSAPSFPAFGFVCNNMTQVMCEAETPNLDDYTCLSDAQCVTESASTPYCTLNDGGDGSMCVECRDDTDCFLDYPICQTWGRASQSTL